MTTLLAVGLFVSVLTLVTSVLAFTTAKRQGLMWFGVFLSFVNIITLSHNVSILVALVA